MLLRDLIAVPRLRLELLHEPPGTKDRSVRRVVTTDLPQPQDYLVGDDFVITGLVWRRSAEDSDVFVRALVRGRAAALAVGSAHLGEIPDDVVDACRRHQLPLIEVPRDVSFSEVVEYLVSSASIERGARLSASLGRQRQLLFEVAAGRTLAELAARVSADIGHACRVLSATGRHVVTGPSPLPPDVVDRVCEAQLTAPRLPVAIGERGKQSYSAFATGPRLDERLTSWSVVVEGCWSDWDGDVVEAIGDLAAIAALERARRDDGQRVARQIAADAIALAGSGGSQHEIAARLTQLGLDPVQPLVLVAACFSGRPDLVETMRDVLEDVAALTRPSAVAIGADGGAVAIMPASAGMVAALRTAFVRLKPGVRASIAVGISAPSSVGALSGALEEARYSRRIAELRGGPVSVVTGDEIASHVLLLATVPGEVRHTYAARVLGPMLDHDERNSSVLRDTLEAFLACSGSAQQTADTLHVHVNTVRYRIERIEQLIDRDLGRTEDQVDVFLALRSL